MRTVICRFSSRQDFNNAFLKDLPHGGIFVTTAEPLDVGAPVLLLIGIPELPDGVTVRGHVAWRRLPTAWRSALVPGMGVAFSALDSGRRDYLVDLATGDLQTVRKSGRRVPADFEALIRCDLLPEPIPAVVRDISRGGLFVVCEQTLPEGAAVEIELSSRHPEVQEKQRGHVVRACDAGREKGLAIEFDFLTPTGKFRVDRLVSEVERRLVSTEPPRPPVHARRTLPIR